MLLNKHGYAMKEFDFNNLFIFDLANNHQGDVEHALNIIQELGDVVKKNKIRAAFKFQFRALDSFIHPDFKSRKDVPHIPRFMKTALSMEDYKIMTDEVCKQGMITICTPFDELSVERILQLNIEIIKIASCSAADMPLLQKIASAGKPVIASTAGLPVSNIDKLVSYFKDKDVHFAIMHCVAIYPTPNNKLKLNQIDFLKSRYPDIPIGFSTHEVPDNLSPIKIAYAKGARLFERHVGKNTEKYKLNAYSSTPEQIDKWIQSYFEVADSCGNEYRSPSEEVELSSLRSLMRGVYVKRNIVKGEKISKDDVFFAMPLQENQLKSGEWVSGIIADKDYEVNSPLSDKLAKYDVSEEQIIYDIMLQVKGMLNDARIFIKTEASLELSHHYGLERFREFGAVIFDIVNRGYCKKIIVMLPRQKHPYHYHKKKEETFNLLAGDLEVELEGKRTKLEPGDLFLIEPNQWHKFHTLDGAIFEEVSSTHFNNDSFYEDEKISKLLREKRKTKVDLNTLKRHDYST